MGGFGSANGECDCSVHVMEKETYQPDLQYIPVVACLHVEQGGVAAHI